MNFKYFKEAYGICPAVKPACSAGFKAGYAYENIWEIYNYTYYCRDPQMTFTHGSWNATTYSS